MAKFQEEMLVIKISKLYRDNEDSKKSLSDELVANIETIVQEMVGPGTLVESEVIQGE